MFRASKLPRASPVSWSAPASVFVALSCNLALFSQANGRTCRSRTLAVNQEYSVPSHNLSRGLGLVCNTLHGRTTSKSLMLQVFLPILGSVGDHIPRPNVPSGFGSSLSLKIQVCTLDTGCINVTAKRFQNCVFFHRGSPCRLDLVLPSSELSEELSVHS